MSSNTSPVLSNEPAAIRKVAVIEDESSIRQMYRYKLEKEGYEVVVAEDGVEGLKIIKNEIPDLILLDLKMPHMGGEEMLAKVRQEEWGADLRVVILTNLNKSEADPSLRLLGVDRYIVKAHTTPSQVVDVIRSL